jgi:hypothetical protein
MLTAGPAEPVQGSPTRVLQRHQKVPDARFRTQSGPYLKPSDGLTFTVTSHSHLSLHLLLFQGEFEIFLVCDVFNSTFTSFLCNPIRRTNTMSVDNELQHLTLSKIAFFWRQQNFFYF